MLMICLGETRRLQPAVKQLGREQLLQHLGYSKIRDKKKTKDYTFWR